MPRHTPNTSGLREQLIADRERSMQRFAIPGKPDDWLEDLRAHVPVVVSSAQLMCALMHAGLPHREFTWEGSGYGKAFVLDERDQLTEYQES